MAPVRGAFFLGGVVELDEAENFVAIPLDGDAGDEALEGAADEGLVAAVELLFEALGGFGEFGGVKLGGEAGLLFGEGLDGLLEGGFLFFEGGEGFEEGGAVACGGDGVGEVGELAAGFGEVGAGGGEGGLGGGLVGGGAAGGGGLDGGEDVGVEDDGLDFF